MTLNTQRATEGGTHVSTSTAFNIVFVSGLASQQERRYAWEKAPEDAAEEPRIVKVLSVLVDEAGLTASPARAHSTVAAAVD